LATATDQVVAAALDANIPLVCGVSGLTDENRQHMHEAAERIPILYDRNMSLGIAVMQQLVQLAGSALGKQFEAEIHETHHVRKIDAPSGTALHLGETLAASRKQDFADVYHYDKDGDSPPIPGNIQYKVARSGDVPGEHTVLLRSADETLSMIHTVTDRRVFADGALRAARWLVIQPRGLYSMQNLVANATYVSKSDQVDARTV
jgi:4-hydroxy-tetrahydrodipicolinate reductase